MGMTIDKTNLRALMRRIRYLEFVIEHKEVKCPPESLMSHSDAYIGLMNYPDCLDHYKMFVRQGYHFKDADLVNEWLYELSTTPNEQAAMKLDPGKESFRKIIVSEAARKAKAEFKDAIKNEFKEALKDFMKSQMALTGAYETVIQTTPVLGQFAAFGYLFTLVFWAMVSGIMMLPVFPCYLCQRSTRAWYTAAVLMNMRIMQNYNNIIVSMCASFAAPAGPVVKWAMNKGSVWALAGTAILQGSKLVYMRDVTGECCGTNAVDELQKARALLAANLYTKELKEIKENFEKHMKEGVDALTVSAEATQARVKEELDKAIEETKDMPLKEFNAYLKKHEKARKKALKEQEKNELSMLDFTELTFNIDDLREHNVATKEEGDSAVIVAQQMNMV